VVIEGFPECGLLENTKKYYRIERNEEELSLSINFME
jgi:hypothetical protein